MEVLRSCGYRLVRVIRACLPAARQDVKPLTFADMAERRRVQTGTSDRTPCRCPNCRRHRALGVPHSV